MRKRYCAPHYARDSDLRHETRNGLPAHIVRGGRRCARWRRRRGQIDAISRTGMNNFHGSASSSVEEPGWERAEIPPMAGIAGCKFNQDGGTPRRAGVEEQGASSRWTKGTKEKISAEPEDYGALSGGTRPRSCACSCFAETRTLVDVLDPLNEPIVLFVGAERIAGRHVGVGARRASRRTENVSSPKQTCSARRTAEPGVTYTGSVPSPESRGRIGNSNDWGGTEREDRIAANSVMTKGGGPGRSWVGRNKYWHLARSTPSPGATGANERLNILVRPPDAAFRISGVFARHRVPKSIHLVGHLQQLRSRVQRDPQRDLVKAGSLSCVRPAAD